MDIPPRPSAGKAYRMLVVDNDRQIHEGLWHALEPIGYGLRMATDGGMALREFNVQKFDIVVMELMLPDIDGVEVLAEMRKISAVPIIILTSRSAAKDIETSFEMGADDYIKKPCAPAQLIERLARHALPRADSTLAIGPLLLWSDRKLIEKDGQTIMLTEVETKLLGSLMASPDQPISAASLFVAAWPHNDATARQMLHIVETAVVQLRKKLATGPKDAALIRSVRGGYRLDANPPQEFHI